MISDERICKKCGHRCHCYQPTCEECVNDVCTGCDCEETGYETLRGEYKLRAEMKKPKQPVIEETEPEPKKVIRRAGNDRRMVR